MRQSGIVVHCSDSPHGRNDTAETIHKWHKERGFDGIGYHFVILEDGSIDRGRPLYWSGAHAKGYNHYIGICLIGVNFFTDAQYESLQDLCNELMQEYNILPENVIGHCDISNKTCPNFDVKLRLGL